MTTSPHLALARRRYGRRAAWIVGDGPHAVLAWCRSLTVALYDDEAEAPAALASLARHGCSGRSSQYLQRASVGSGVWSEYANAGDGLSPAAGRRVGVSPDTRPCSISRATVLCPTPATASTSWCCSTPLPGRTPPHDRHIRGPLPTPRRPPDLRRLRGKPAVMRSAPMAQRALVLLDVPRRPRHREDDRMTADQTAAAPFPHKPACPGAELHRFPGKFGDDMERCRGCTAVRTVPLTVTQAPLDDGRGPAERAGARHVCRLHPDQAVTWTGRGCPRCAREAAERPTRRRRRAARLDDDTTE